jgi:DNA-binding MarR family transcriptional regulator
MSPIEKVLWRRLTTLSVRLPAALDTGLGREHSMTHFEYRVLAALAEAPDRTLQLKVLARHTDSSLSRLSHVVKKLADQKLLTRVGVPGGRRHVDAVLTDGGLAVVEAVTPTVEAIALSLVFDALEPHEADQLFVLLGAVTDQLTAVLELDAPAEEVAAS